MGVSQAPIAKDACQHAPGKAGWRLLAGGGQMVGWQWVGGRQDLRFLGRNAAESAILRDDSRLDSDLQARLAAETAIQLTDFL
jgi:hypothetical protein